MNEIGRGTGYKFDVLELKRFMTIRELREAIARLPDTASICFQSMHPQLLAAERIRVPVQVNCGRVNDATDELVELPKPKPKES